MSTLNICVIASSLGAYIIWGYQALKKDLKPEEGASFSSLLLWSIIDIIMWINTVRAKTDQTLIATYTILTVALTLLLIIKKRFGWNKGDWFVAIIAAACLVVSYLTEPTTGVLCGALSISAAGIPTLLKIAVGKPTNLLYATILFFFIGPTLTTFGVFVNNGTLKDYIYPVVAMVYWSIAFLIAIIKHAQSLRPEN